MDIGVNQKLNDKADVLVVGLFENEQPRIKELSDELNLAIKNKQFKWDFGQTFVTKISPSPHRRIIVVSLGKKDEFTLNRLRIALSKAVNYLKASKFTSFTTDIVERAGTLKFNVVGLGRAAAEGLILSEYSFDKYLSKREDARYSASLVFSGSKEFMDGLREGRVIAESTNYSKTLVNEPSNVVTPQRIAEEAKLLSKDKRVKLKILDRKESEKLGLNLLVSVGKGSPNDPRLILIEYNGGSAKDEKIALVGKGVAFDSGGYDIKPAGQFTDMKCDMAGAAAVLGTLKVACALNIKKNLIGVIPTCENLVDGNSYKPGDIIKAYNGKTVEINNTDAEGRLILADAIAYVEKNYKPSIIIDLATLTGACVVALGYYAAGLVSNDDKLSSELVHAGTASYDRVWKLPFFEEYHDWMDGDISDLKNLAARAKGREGGAITGAVFISKFVDKAKWAHLDIAGTAFLAEAKDYNQKYASGAGVRLLSYYLMG